MTALHSVSAGSHGWFTVVSWGKVAVWQEDMKSDPWHCVSGVPGMDFWRWQGGNGAWVGATTRISVAGSAGRMSLPTGCGGFEPWAPEIILLGGLLWDAGLGKG